MTEAGSDARRNVELNMKNRSTILLLVLAFGLLSSCSRPNGGVSRKEYINGKTEELIIGLGDFENLVVYGNPDGPFLYELHFQHGKGELVFDREADPVEPISISKLKSYARDRGCKIRNTRLYLYIDEVDDLNGFRAQIDDVVKMKFGEVRIRYIKEWSEEPAEVPNSTPEIAPSS